MCNGVWSHCYSATAGDWNGGCLSSVCDHCGLCCGLVVCGARFPECRTDAERRLRAVSNLLLGKDGIMTGGDSGAGAILIILNVCRNTSR